MNEIEYRMVHGKMVPLSKEEMEVIKEQRKRSIEKKKLDKQKQSEKLEKLSVLRNRLDLSEEEFNLLRDASVQLV